MIEVLWSTVHNISLHWVEDLFQLSNFLLWNVEMGQCLGQVKPGLVECFLVDFELSVGGFHVKSLVFVGTSGDKGDELFLPWSLFFHVGVGKEVFGDLIGKHEFIELVDDGTDGSLSS